MNVEKRRMYFLICILSIIVFFVLISGCSKESKIERHWKKAETYFSENKLKEAVIEYKNIIQLEPKHSKTYYKLGMAYYKNGTRDLAKKELSAALKINSGFAGADEAKTALNALK